MKLTAEEILNYNDFEDIDRKVQFIRDNKHICAATLREYNDNIDIDYVKQSEFLENNTIEELKEFEIDDNTKILKGESGFFENLPADTSKYGSYVEFLKNQYEDSSLIIMKKKDDGSVSIRTAPMPSHLSAVGYALREARRQQNLIDRGEKVDLEPKFIEKLNAFLFKHMLEFGEIVGYGNFRHSIYYCGNWLKSNVKIDGADWEAAESDDVYDEMMRIIDEYNNSTAHPIVKAIKFKVDFIHIHPFRDGNGRTARILLNYMLVRFGYPTITIKGSQKKNYISAMNKAIVENDYMPLLELIKKAMNSRCDKYIQIIKECTEMKNHSI